MQNVECITFMRMVVMLTQTVLMVSVDLKFWASLMGSDVVFKLSRPYDLAARQGPLTQKKSRYVRQPQASQSRRQNPFP